MSQRQWYYASGNQPVGPISEEQMLDLIRSGRVTGDMMVWTQGMPQWQRASEVDCLDPSKPRPAPEETAEPAAELDAEAPDEQAAVDTVSVEYGRPSESQSQYGQAGVAYQPCGRQAYPVDPERPTSVTVFGVLNIVFAGLNLLCTPIGMIFIFMGDEINPEIRPPTPAVAVWMVVSFIVGYIMGGIVLLAIGIGLLKLKAWARKGAIVYSWFAILWAMLGVIVTASLVMGGAYRGQADAVSAMFGAIAGGVIGLIYPILLLVFMKKPHVIQACSR